MTNYTNGTAIVRYSSAFTRPTAAFVSGNTHSTAISGQAFESPIVSPDHHMK
jgi:hypothetical protein